MYRQISTLKLEFMYSKIIQTLVLSLFLLSAAGQGAYNDKQINENSLFFANEIAKGSMVQGNAVGFAGIKPQQAYHYDSLIHYSSEKELIELTNHSDAKVRCYAFKGLVNTNSKNIAVVLRKNEKDSAKIQSQSGCIVSSQSAVSYMLYSISPELLPSLSVEDRKYILELKDRIRYY